MRFDLHFYDYSIKDFESARKHHNKVEKHFYDRASYKWTIQKAKEYCETNRIHPTILHAELTQFYIHCNKNNWKFSTTKSAEKFVDRFRKSRYFKNSLEKGKIRVKEMEGFLYLLKQLSKGHLEISQTDFIRFIYHNFDTGYTLDTLKRKYFDEINPPESK